MTDEEKRKSAADAIQLAFAEDVAKIFANLASVTYPLDQDSVNRAWGRCIIVRDMFLKAAKL